MAEKKQNLSTLVDGDIVAAATEERKGSSLNELRAEHAALGEKFDAALATAADLGDDLTADAKSDVVLAHSELTAVTDLIASLQDGVDSIPGLGRSDAPAAVPAADNVGAREVGSVCADFADMARTRFEAVGNVTDVKSFRHVNQNVNPHEISATFTLPRRDVDGIQPITRDSLDFLGLMGTVRTPWDRSVYSYRQASKSSGNVGSRAKGAAIAALVFATNRVNEPIQSIGAKTTVNNEDLRDDSFALRDMLDMELLAEVQKNMEWQLMAGNTTGGDNVATNLVGLLNRSIGSTTVTEASDKLTDVLGDIDTAYFKIKKDAGGATPTHVVCHSSVDELLQGEAPDNQFFYLSDAVNGFSPRVRGMRIVTLNNGLDDASENAAGKTHFVVGAFSSRYIRYIEREGLEQVWGFGDGDFDNNRATLRILSRIGLALPVPAAFVKGVRG